MAFKIKSVFGFFWRILYIQQSVGPSFIQKLLRSALDTLTLLCGRKYVKYECAANEIDSERERERKSERCGYVWFHMDKFQSSLKKTFLQAFKKLPID